MRRGHERRERRLWIVGDILESPTLDQINNLTWECPECGIQPPVQLAGNRWMRRQCACQRAVQEQSHKPRVISISARKLPGLQPMERVGSLLPSVQIGEQPPDEFYWICDVCGLIEPLRIPSGRWIRRSCECQRQARAYQEEEERRAAWRREQAYRTFGGWLGEKWQDPRIIREMTSKTFDSFDVLRQPEAYAKAYAFAEHPVGNLLFSGEFGTGKTHLCAAIANHLREVGMLFPSGSRQPLTSLFISAPQFFLAYEETRRAVDKTAHIRLMNMMTTTPLLIFDDVDKSAPTDSRHETYWLIFDERAKARRATLVSTNKREELGRYIGEASVSRLSRGLIAITMIGDDYRREAL